LGELCSWLSVIRNGGVGENLGEYRRYVILIFCEAFVVLRKNVVSSTMKI
jgi:hypothetical protein